MFIYLMFKYENIIAENSFSLKTQAVLYLIEKLVFRIDSIIITY
jgi:hypothetical protein